MGRAAANNATAPKYHRGDRVRYGSGKTATFTITEVVYVSGVYRYYGKQDESGSSIGRYEYEIKGKVTR